MSNNVPGTHETENGILLMIFAQPFSNINECDVLGWPLETNSIVCNFSKCSHLRMDTCHFGK